MNALPSKSVVATAVACALVLAGCNATSPSKFYLLTSIPQSERGVHTVPAREGLAVGIGPIELPSYVNRPQVVTRMKQNEVHLAEFNQWAEPLKESVTRVLAENLSILLSTDEVAVYPWKQAIKVDYQVSVEVTEFGMGANGETSLVARSRIFTGDGRTLLLTKRSTLTQRSADQDYREMASAMSRNFADLSEEIAEAIRSIAERGRVDKEG